MLDYTLFLATTATVAATLILASRLVFGRPRTRLGGLVRALVAVPLAAALAFAVFLPIARSRSFQLAGEIVRRVETDKKIVALTFDDGPTAEHTAEVIDLLAAEGVSATFFVTGRESRENASQAAALVEAGHELGNHTDSHGRLIGRTGADVARELDATDKAIRAAGWDGPIYFRPPGCKRLLTAPLVLARTGRTTVIWDVEADSDGSATDAETLAANTLAEVRPGSIVLLHVMYDSREVSRDALPLIIDGLKSRGYEFATLSEMLGRP